MSLILDTLTLFCYVLSTLFHWMFLGSRKRMFFLGALGAAGVGFVIHTGYLSMEALKAGPLVFSELQGATRFFSWTVVLVYSIAEGLTRIRALGSFLVPIGLLALLLGLALPFEDSRLLPPLSSFWLILHVVLAFLGNAAFALTFCGGLMYLIQDRYLKAKQPGGFSSRLPSLEMLDRLNLWALAFGLPLLTQGLVTGAIWARYARGSFWIWERTTWPLIVIWGIYTLLFLGRWYLGWRGRRAAFAVVAGFCAVSIGYLMHTLG
ncbi:MAG: cytochrome c biogenesis protein CcsA [Nitrospinae bacterium]|nr:cytochrome c biogenesis protein CcsA [Nitrospinota bacterium]